MIYNSKFGGLIPRIHTRILPNGSAEVAVDVNLEHGSIKPWPRPTLKCDVGQDVVTVHFDKNCACVTWPVPVDVVDYIAGGCEFKIWNERDRLRIESPSNFCNGLECFLGVPCPTEPLLIDDDGFYVYTWINKFGQESPPSIFSSSDLVQGVCGSIDSENEGLLLGPTPLQSVASGQTITELSNAAVLGIAFNDSSEIGFTVALVRAVEPDPGFFVHAIDLFKSDPFVSAFAFFMDSDGFMNITATNISDVEILNVQITNNGGTFANAGLHFFGVNIDLTDITKREIYYNGSNITESSWVTWNTYINDVIELEDKGPGVGDISYGFGVGLAAPTGWNGVASNYNGEGEDVGTVALGFISFSDECSLVPAAMWDKNGWVRDPGEWEGWYLTQPQVFYGPSFWRNTGKTGLTSFNSNDLERVFGYYLNAGNQTLQSDNTVINFGIGGEIEPVAGAGSSGAGFLPPAPDPDLQVEIVAPFWANTGNWIDLSALTQTTFLAMFGVNIEDADFDKVVAVNKAALVNTADVGNRIQLQDSIDAQDAALFITDASGNVVDSMIYDSTPNSDSVIVPTGSDHYVVITSDTGNARVRKWDTSTIDLTGSTPWEDFFGAVFGSEIIHDATAVIPASGIGLAFTVPATLDSIKVSFGSIAVPAVPTTRTGSVNQTVGDYTSDPTFIWGNGTGFTGGINLAGEDIALIPGKTYIFNIKNDSPGSPNFIRIQTSYVVQ